MKRKQATKEPAKATLTRGEARDRLAQMQAVATKCKAFRPAPEVLTVIKSIPTRFVQVDCATRVAGWPIERVATIHGPSNHGKTEFLHGLGLSFLEQGSFYAFIDAEFTTPTTWLRELMGQYASHPGFVALRPDSFEQTVDAVRDFVENIAEARAAGRLDPATTAIIGVDSIRKLIPDRLLAKIAAQGAQGKRGSVDGMGGRAAQYKAALQSQWLDELVPLLASTRTALVFVTREADDPLADNDDLKYDQGWKVQGSKSLVYDASLVVRITRAGWVTTGPESDKIVVGERHRCRIWKTKIGGKDDRHTDAYFHVGNGAEGFVGFDKARDVFELAKELGVIEQSGSWFSFGRKKWQGVDKALMILREGLVTEVEAEVRAAFGKAQGIEQKGQGNGTGSDDASSSEPAAEASAGT